MWKDEIVEDIRKIRDAHASKFNYDLNAILNDLKMKEKSNPAIKLSFNPKPFRPKSNDQIGVANKVL